jgi:hypothetical protein
VKIPRDLNGADLARRQHLTIPAHKPMRVGTLRQILKDMASQTGVSLEEVVQSIGH